VRAYRFLMTALHRMPSRRVTLAVILCLALIGSSEEGFASPEGALARITVWLPPEQVAAFGPVFDEHLAPVLRDLDMPPTGEAGRAVNDSAFCRLLGLASVQAPVGALVASQPAWTAAVEAAGRAIGDTTLCGTATERAA
jgi:hypothetical protein